MDAAAAGALLALGASLAWGVGDFAGGLATRRAKVWGVVLVTNAGGALLILAMALASREALPDLRAVGWAAVASVGSVIGLTSLYQGLSVGRMGVVAPVSAVVTALVPVAVGALLEGPPGGWAYPGFAAALVGIALVSWARTGEGAAGLGLGALAGLGFGLFLVAIREATLDALWWPLVVARVVALAAVALIVLATRRDARIPLRVAPIALVAVALDTAANVLYALATRVGRLDVAGVLSSLYPAVTVGLAVLVLRERVSLVQAVGVAFLLAAVALIVS